MMSFFLTERTACRTMASWLSYMTPASFWARRARNFYFTFEKTNSIGLYSGSYGTFQMTLKPSLVISVFDFSLRCTARLSINRAILFVPLSSRSSCRYPLNF